MIGMKKLAQELGKTIDEIDEVRKQKLGKKHWRKMSWGIAIMPAGEEIIRNNYIAPEIYPVKRLVFAKKQCANPRWLWCVIEGLEGRHQVLIPRRYIGKLLGKSFVADEIRDINGVTYRHEALGG